MTVYVDTYLYHRRGSLRLIRRHRLMADTRSELIGFAAGIGLRASLLNDEKAGVWFGLSEAKRRRAVAAGAVEIDWMSHNAQWVRAAARRQWSGRHDSDGGAR
ncbi:MAG: DUF4031 domain-containing protein [Nocardioides sp.]